jgi:hypothetical protein
MIAGHGPHYRIAGPIVMTPATLLLALLLSAQDAAPPPAVQTLRRFAAPEATQAVAVDGAHFYAIGSTVIAKYDKQSGARVAVWREARGGRIAHLNSGVVIGAELFAAHSNYPATPMVSSVEVFDTARMTHLRTIPLPGGYGSATWVERLDGDWLVAFAHYAGRGGVPGKGPQDTVLVRFDGRWQPRATWSFPTAVVSRWDGMSTSGGVIAGGRRLIATGHHAPELHLLDIPEAGRELVFRGVVPIESEGQGIAIDRTAGRLYSIQRRTREVLVSTLPR